MPAQICGVGIETVETEKWTGMWQSGVCDTVRLKCIFLLYLLLWLYVCARMHADLPPILEALDEPAPLSGRNVFEAAEKIKAGFLAI